MKGVTIFRNPNVLLLLASSGFFFGTGSNGLGGIIPISPVQPEKVSFISSATDHFRSKPGIGNWSEPAIWETSPDRNEPWIVSTNLTPDEQAASITIQSGSTVTLDQEGRAKNLIIENSGTLIHENSHTLNVINGLAEDDFKIYGTYVLFGESAIMDEGSSARVYSGGVVRVDENTPANSAKFAYHPQIYFESDAVFEWNTDKPFETSGVVYFPNAGVNTIPIFRISKPVIVGSTGINRINGLLQINAKTIFTNNSRKEFRNGICGSDTLTASHADVEFVITGNNAILGGSGLKIQPFNKSLRLESDMIIPADSVVVITGNINNNAVPNATLTVEGTLDISDNQIANTGNNIIVSATGLFRTSRAGGFTGTGSSIPSGNVSLQQGSTIEFYADGNQNFAARSDYSNMIFSGSGTKIPSNAFAPQGTITIKDDAIFDCTGKNVGGINTHLIMTGGRLIVSTTGTQPAIGGNFDITGGVIEFANNSQTAQTIRNQNYYQIEVTGTNVKNSSGIIGIKPNGSFIVRNGGVFTSSSGNAPIDTAVRRSGQIVKIESGGIFKTEVQKGFYGETGHGINDPSPSIRDNIPNIILEPGSTIEYSRSGIEGGGDQEISVHTNLPPYQHVILSGSGKKTVPDQSILEINGNFSVKDNAWFDPNDGEVIFSSNQKQTISSSGNPVEFFDLTNLNTIILQAGLNSTSGDLLISNSLKLGDQSKLLLNSGDVVIKSTAVQTARVDKIPETANISYGGGRFRIERHIDKHPKAWQLLSVNVSGGTIQESWQNNQVDEAGRGVLITSSLWSDQDNRGFDDYSSAPSMKYYNTGNQNYAGVTSTYNVLDIHPAYFLFVRGDRFHKHITDKDWVETTIHSTGKLYAPDNLPPAQTIPAANSDGSGGYALLGNPYASSIDFTKLDKSGGTIEDGYYIWSAQLEESYKENFYLYGQGAFRKVVYVNGVGMITVPGTTDTTNNVNFLQSGQGFFVRNTSTTAPATVTFSEAAKVSNAGVNIFRPTTPLAPSPMIRTNLYVNMEDSVQVLIDGTLHIFGDEYSAGVDYLDAQKVANPGENIQLPAKKYPLIVERRPFPVNGDTLFYNISQMANKQYSLQLTLENVANDQQDIYLHDAYQKTETLLHEGENRIDFAINSSAASKAKARFYLTFAQPPLPFAFENEQAVTSGEQIHVSWMGAHQSGVAGYIVEHAADGKTFQPVKQEVASSSENGSYSYSDILPESGSHSYRIKVTFQDGSFAYSKTVSASIAYDAPTITIYPNPVKDVMQLKFYRQTDGRYLISLSNMQGQHVLSKEISHSGFKRIYPVELPNLSSGVYQMEITAPGGFRKTERVVVR